MRRIDLRRKRPVGKQLAAPWLRRLPVRPQRPKSDPEAPGDMALRRLKLLRR